jgi:hypothetical protein
MSSTAMDMLLTKVASDGNVLPAAREAHYSGQLEKIARVVAGMDNSSEEFAITDAVKSLGRKLYVKRAEHRLIATGLEALRALDND